MHAAIGSKVQFSSSSVLNLQHTTRARLALLPPPWPKPWASENAAPAALKAQISRSSDQRLRRSSSVALAATARDSESELLRADAGNSSSRGALGKAPGGRMPLPRYIERYGEASLLGFRLELDKRVEVGTIIGVLRRAPSVPPTVI